MPNVGFPIFDSPRAAGPSASPVFSALCAQNNHEQELVGVRHLKSPGQCRAFPITCGTHGAQYPFMWQRGLYFAFWDNLEQRKAGALAFFSTALPRVGNIKACLCEPEKGRRCSCTVEISGENNFLFAQVQVRNFKIFEIAGVPKNCQAREGEQHSGQLVILNLSNLFDLYSLLSSLCSAWICNKLKSILSLRTTQTTHHPERLLQGR